MSILKLSKLLALGGMILSLAGGAMATPPSPTYGTAVVDGAYLEWDLVVDRFADMHEAGDQTHPLISKAYLRYDCRTSTAFVLVLTEPGVIGYHDSSVPAATSWVAIDRISRKRVNEDSGNDGVPPDFAFVDPAFDGDPNHNHGFEASFALAPGSYLIFIHTKFWNGVSGGTTATIGSPQSGVELVIDCTLLGACCAPTGNCTLTTMTDCLPPNRWDGAGTICAPNPCPTPPPVGGCCFEDGHCELLSQEQCLAAPEHVSWLGEAVPCWPDNPCPQPGACCDLATGACSFLLQNECEEPLEWLGGECGPVNPCSLPPRTGACCYTSGTCSVVTEEDCQAAGGFLWSLGEDCVDDCPPVSTRSTTWGKLKAVYR